jgi:hypothetical protein
MPKVVVTPQTETYQTVGKPEKKVDAIKLVQGKPAFTADLDMRGMLYARVLRSRMQRAQVTRQKRAERRCCSAHGRISGHLFYRGHPTRSGLLDAFSLDNKVAV